MSIFLKNKRGVDIEQSMMIINWMISAKILEMELKVSDKILLKTVLIKKKNKYVNQNWFQLKFCPRKNQKFLGTNLKIQNQASQF